MQRGHLDRCGQRVVVTGRAGAGKSTFSDSFAAATGLPIVGLDLHYWKPGWVAPSESEWRAKQLEILSGQAWIADGNYHETLALRLDLADTLVVLDLPWWVCVRRALLRGFQMPDQLPEGSTYTRWQRLWDEWKLAGLIWRNRRSDTERERALVAQHRRPLVVHVLTSQREVQEFLGE